MDHPHVMHAQMDRIQGMLQQNVLCARQGNTLVRLWPPPKTFVFLALLASSQKMVMGNVTASNSLGVRYLRISPMRTQVLKFRFLFPFHFFVQIITAHLFIHMESLNSPRIRVFLEMLIAICQFPIPRGHMLPYFGTTLSRDLTPSG